MNDLVFVVPGFGGSQLGRTLPVVGTRIVWVAYDALAVGGPRLLTLGSDGTGGGPGAVLDLTAQGLYPGVYDPLIQRLDKLGLEVWTFGYDWRRSIADLAPLFGQAVNQLLADNPGRNLHVVAHSMGGLIARLAYGYVDQPKRSQWVSSIYLGTPHGGSYEAARAILGDGAFFQLANKWNRLRNAIVGTLLSQQLADVIVTWPSLREMVPSATASWASLDPMAGQLVKEGTYKARAVPTQAQWDAAVAVQQGLESQLTGLHPATQIDMVGDSLPTVTEVHAISLDNEGPSRITWAIRPEGDGVVPRNRATLPGTQPVVFLGVQHHQLPASGVVLDRLADVLSPPPAGPNKGPFRGILPDVPPAAVPTPIRSEEQGFLVMEDIRPGSIPRRGDP